MKRLLLLFFCVLHLSILGQVASIPFEKDGLVYIQVKFPESDTPLQFVFDTGASSAVIDTEAAKRIGLTSNHFTAATGTSGTQTYELATGKAVSIEGVSFTNIEFVFVDLSELSKRSGRPIEGIIGYDILSKFTTLMDFDKEQIELYASIEEINNHKEYKSYPMTMDLLIPLVELDYTLQDGTALKGKFLFDSGAHLTLLFNSPYAETHTLEKKIGKTVSIKSRGLTASSTNISGSLPTLTMSGHTFMDVPVSISLATSGVSAYTQISGILGAKLIERFNVIVDYANYALYLRPNSHFAEAFEYHIKGFVLENVVDKVMISQVFESSQAYAKGIRVGDQLLRIDGVSYPTLKGYRNALKTINKTVTLSVLTKDGNTVDYTITLQRIA